MLDNGASRGPREHKTDGYKPMSEKQQNLQDTFLNAVRKSKSSVTIFLVNGVKLQGNITWFDNFCVLLRRDGQAQLVYKHAISTVMPLGPIQLQEERAAARRPKPRRTITRREAGARRSSFMSSRSRAARADALDRDAKARLAEAVGLTAAIGLHVVAATHRAAWRAPTPATLIGSGKVDEIAADARALEPEVIIVNAQLSPVQQRNLEKAWDAKVLDRTALILEIFGERARDPGRPAAGRAGASDLSAQPAGADLDPSWSASAAASASWAARAKPRSKPTAA